ncbi:glycosyltransferase [Flavobacterium psychrophilum]|uniref:Glycosyltransferase n=1 Tax=Flavobacterium psychrophilum TaxID=96345 RepID=A0A7U2NHB2_FLAPS|nr:glycosyltransferase [Flavobacterium psychrophilum]QRE05191.1 glycosyltransferase [Flavobacterium psychrophilum]
MSITPKKKILLVTTSLAEGGAERSTGLLSVLLSEMGYKVHIVTFLDKVEFRYEGVLFNMGKLKEANNTFLGRIKRFLIYKKYIKTHKFDWIIDNRTRYRTLVEIIFSKLFYTKKSNLIYMVRSFNISWYFPKNKIVAKNIYKSAKYIIGVSKEIKNEIENTYQYNNVRSIYNPIDFENINELALKYKISEKYILAYGRIDDEVKNYSLLIDAYSFSELPKNNIFLYILGDGKDLKKMKDKVVKLKLSDKVKFCDKQVNPFPYVKQAICTVLTSKFEGFPRVVIESLALNTPVISVNCKSGPEEIIINKKNGLLVDNNNIELLSEAMNKMVLDHDLYSLCKKYAKDSIEYLSLENISKEWNKLLES